MPTQTNRRWLIAKPLEGKLSQANFRWMESTVPSVADGQFLVHNRWLSVDPTQVLVFNSGDPPGSAVPIGEAPWSLAVSEVVESRHPAFSRGDIVHGQMAWEDYTLTDGTGFNPAFPVPAGIPLDWAAGALGLTGLVAYFGLHEVARPKPGETFVISGAAGGVGSIASQLAKIHGLRVIGIAGSPAKCDWLVREAGVDAAINYHQEDVGKRLTELCPQGIDIFFDTVGGPTLELALHRLRTRGRVVLCGITSQYLADPPAPGPANLVQLIMVNGRMEGFLGRDFIPRRSEAFDAMLPLLRSGRLKSKEDVLVGLREAPKALARLLSGENVGKQLVRMDEPPGS
ncbi:MAG: NADP-dependent oxidoreductase [Euryarchaeota archaeon]|nr:NADP-dependent oxidoreductase [Euryarchaeota archaeon]MDE1835748.1 NADP-dependent oxidoreductase [Euryarchaeota archaeon]MDE1880827.1 NADP-dependent oxidoreductase [Euryarchaeota archaeon]MDE2043939.1 NADP-dependent oxidoreductase [Thermoplasmata archaeon]